METKRRLALLVDGDNAQASLIGPILKEVSKHGVIKVRNVYGDWSKPHLKSWGDVLHIHALNGIQQHSYAAGKGATDSALIIGAMDILYAANVDGICIVSSDSDYTPLASRIHAEGLFVIGVGRKETPRAFFEACDEFVYTEDLQSPSNLPEPITTQPSSVFIPSISTVTIAESANGTSVIAQPMTNALKKLLRKVITEAGQPDGWTTLTAVGSTLKQLDPDFSPSKYGYSKLSLMILANANLFEIEKRGNTDFVRLKGQSNAGS